MESLTTIDVGAQIIPFHTFYFSRKAMDSCAPTWTDHVCICTRVELWSCVCMPVPSTNMQLKWTRARGIFSISIPIKRRNGMPTCLAPKPRHHLLMVMVRCFFYIQDKIRGRDGTSSLITTMTFSNTTSILNGKSF